MTESRTEHIECPTCQGEMEVAWYYYESDPNEQPYVDWEVYVTDADCDHDLTVKQQEHLLDIFRAEAR